MNKSLSSKNEYIEKPWTDARIRLIGEYCTKGIDEIVEDDEDSTENSESPETHHFRFPNPRSTGTNNLDDDEKSICIELEGYTMDSGRVWSSTGLTIWRASGVMCDYLMENDAVLKSRRILELGAGLGLCGILTHRITPDSTFVCLTDGDTDTLKQLRNNINQNCQKNSESLNSSTTIACHQLLWGRKDALSFLDKHCDGGKTFDLLLGSDIIYAECIIEPLWETVKVLLTEQTGIFIMAFSSGRQVGSISKVLDKAERSGFTYKCVAENRRKCAHDEGISIYVFKWK